MDILQLIGSMGGIAGIFGYLMFLAYRHTISQMRQDRMFMEDRLTKIIESDQKSREEHTKVFTELYTYLKLKNGSH